MVLPLLIRRIDRARIALVVSPPPRRLAKETLFPFNGGCKRVSWLPCCLPFFSGGLTTSKKGMANCPSLTKLKKGKKTFSSLLCFSSNRTWPSPPLPPPLLCHFVLLICHLHFLSPPINLKCPLFSQRRTEKLDTPPFVVAGMVCDDLGINTCSFFPLQPREAKVYHLFLFSPRLVSASSILIHKSVLVLV